MADMWTPFVEGKMPPEYTDVVAIRKKCPDMTLDEAHQMAARLRRERVYRNNRYQVHIREIGSPADTWPEMIHLSIKRVDKEVIHDWRDLQRIKNELVGPEHEAVELYPAESRLVDEANQYHLWVFKSAEPRWPFGSEERRVATPEEAAVSGAKQRAFEND